MNTHWIRIQIIDKIYTIEWKMIYLGVKVRNNDCKTYNEAIVNGGRNFMVLNIDFILLIVLDNN